jgi:hypothetical protein
MIGMELVPHGDGWLLPVSGEQVTRCWVDPTAVGLLCRNAIEISIGEPFTLATPEGHTYALDPGGEATGLAPFLRIMRQIIREGIAVKDGRLTLVFDDGSRIDVPSGQDFEAWTLAGPGGIDGLKIVSAPEGKLVIWSDRRNERDAKLVGHELVRAY